jgi:polyferredoxin
MLARPVQGWFRTQRTRANAVLIAILFAVPWIRVGGEPLVLLDVPNRQFHVFGMVIFPQELFFLWLILAGLALALFFFTALAGRLWCGWACPQTVFTDVYSAVARRLQGWTRSGPPKRIAPWRRAATHAAWIALSAIVGLHLVGYFRSIEDLVRALAHGAWAGPSMGFWIAATALCYLDFGIVQQTFCKYLCPYARFQSVLLDRESLVVAYDPRRGEPRGKALRTQMDRSRPDRSGEARFPRSEPQASGEITKLARSEPQASGEITRPAGDCVDCGLCVAVCPTGIDIRRGLQLECIACTQCIDACNGVMERVGRPRNLIGYRSLASLEGRRTRLARPRVAIYAALLVAAAAGFAVTLARRAPLSLEVERNRSALYQRMADGRIGNAYTLHLQNRDRREHAYRIRLEPAEGYQLIAGVNPLRIPATGTITASVFVVADRKTETPAGGAQIQFVLENLDDLDLAVMRESRFVAPAAPREDGDGDEKEEDRHAS